MSLTSKTLLLATVIFTAACASTDAIDTQDPVTQVTAKKQAPAPKQVAKSSRERVSCRKIARVGTHMRSRQCATASEAREARAVLHTQQRRGG